MMDMDKAIEQAKAAVMPFESWEQLPGESGLAYAAFRAFRDLGYERNIRKAAICYANRSEFDGRGGAASEQRQGIKPSNSTQAIERRYRVYRNWCSAYRWRERAADYDRYTEKLKQAERRKTIEAQEEQHRAVTRKMLEKVEKKLDLMDPADLTQNTVTEWVETAVRVDREAAGQVTSNGKSEPKQGEINFTAEFEGL
jgi:hypothetical protein